MPEVNNVYLHKGAVQSFIEAIRYDQGALGEVASGLLELLSIPAAGCLRLLDIGIGDGAFTIPLLESFERTGVQNYHLDCFDVSSHMLDKLHDRMTRSPAIETKVSPEIRDAELGLLSRYAPSSYHLIVLTFVLQYIHNWQRLLDEAVQCLRPGGILLQAEIAGDMRLVDGRFDVNTSSEFHDFWRYYFEQRDAISRWEAEISVADLGAAYRYLRTEQCLNEVRCGTHLWNLQVTWDHLCKWVVGGPVSSLGSGLKQRHRDDLGRLLREWVRTRGIGLQQELNLTWGFEITCFVKAS